jgi:regulation of enolase protein 1 (concanavalin A-like superfamily)
MHPDKWVSIASLPTPLHWRGAPQNWELDAHNVLLISAGQRTDWFIDPESGFTVSNAPALLLQVQAPCQLSALVTVDSAATFDAGVLAVYQADQQWAKLCFELSPQGQLTVVSVVTNGVSDDCNSVPIAGKSVHLRLAKLERAYAFHFSVNGREWNLVRYFSLGGSQEAEIGFLAQSPTGDGCIATFKEITYLPQKLGDIRSGE